MKVWESFDHLSRQRKFCLRLGRIKYLLHASVITFQIIIYYFRDKKLQKKSLANSNELP